MVDAGTVRLQHRWVAVSFLLTAGYWLLCELLAAVYLLASDPWLTSAAAVATATAGSFSASRLSPLRRGLEPITGATAFFVAAITVWTATQGDIAPFEPDHLDGAWVFGASLGIVVGAVLGAWWGKRGRAEAPRWLTMLLLSAVLVWGSVLAFMWVAALPAALAGSEPAGPMMLSATIVGIAGGGWIAQMLAPVRRFDSIASGAMIAFGLSVLMVPRGILMAAIGAPIVFCIAAVGARSGWSWAEWWRQRQQREAEAPPTAVVVD